MYGKLFDSMFDGTLYGHWEAIVTLQQMVILCTPDGILDMTPQTISARTSIPLKIITKGLKVLEQPDPYTRTTGEEGRRIILMDARRPWGWVIVNHQVYQRMQDADTVRAQTRERVRKHRERAVTVGNGSKRHSDSYSNSNKTTASGGKPPDTNFEQVWQALPKRTGNNPKKRAARTYQDRIAEGCAPQEILDGALRYARFCKATSKEGTEFVMQVATFLGPERAFLQPWTIGSGRTRWDATNEGILAKAAELGISTRGETAETLKAQIRERLGVAA